MMFPWHMSRSYKIIGGIITAVLIIIGLGIMFQDRLVQQAFAPLPAGQDSQVEVGESTKSVSMADREIVAEGLEIPWGIAFLPDGDLLVTERPGRLVRIGESRQIIPIDGVEHAGEGGLLGVALHPNFSQNNLLYLYLTVRNSTGLINRVERYQLTGNQLTNRTNIIDNLPGAQFHDGGQLAFGPDGKLYITVGDATEENAAQNTQALNGKIIRLNDDGSIPADNPFGNAVYSYGHRNPQGLAWDESGNLWATEHGRSGLKSGFDELNLIRSSQNYGWPLIEGSASQEGMQTPNAHSGASDTWAPGGITYLDGSLLFGGLRGQSLYQATIQSDRIINITAHFSGEYGRIRAVTLGPDGFIYLSTSNRDGRGTPETGDDKIIRINPAIFQQ